MGSNLSLIHLPAQSGKTRKITELIDKWNLLISSSTSPDDKNLNIIFTSNTKLLTKQTASRIRDAADKAEKAATYYDCSDMSDLSDDDDLEADDDCSLGLEGEDANTVIDRTLVWISSKGKRALTVNDVDSEYIVDDNCDSIICCSNSTRMKYALALIEKLYKRSARGKFDRKINVFIDEADESIGIWKKHIAPLKNMSEFVQNVILVTATMIPVYKHLLSVDLPCNVRTYECTLSEVYVKYSETNKITMFSNVSRNAHDHVIEVIDKNQGMCLPGTKWFCPGDKKRESHEMICEELLNRGFNVMIVNGNTKAIRFADRSPQINIAEMLDDDLEIAKTLNRIYYEYGLFDKPFAVTGHLCVGRGITFASQIDGNEFIFTHGVIPDMSNGDEGYQLVARCLGNIRKYATFTPPIIFISDKMDAKIRPQEDLAIKLAATLYSKSNGMEVVNVTGREIVEAAGVDMSVALKPSKPRKPRKQYASGDKEHCVFDTQDEANKFIKIKFAKNTHKRSGVAPTNLIADFGKDNPTLAGQNPTVEWLINRWWGLDENNICRMSPTNDGKWCVYWRPSLVA
jgi:hypothetical protein